MEKVCFETQVLAGLEGGREKQTNSEEKGLFLGEKQRWGGETFTGEVIGTIGQLSFQN